MSLDNYGWADVTIQNEGNNYKIASISYLSDSFTDLSEAILQLLKGTPEASCAFEHESGRTKIHFIRHGKEILLKVYSFENELREEPWEKGQVVYETITPLIRLKSQYLNEAETILKIHGLDRYKETWGYEFPVKIYEQIKSF